MDNIFACDLDNTLIHSYKQRAADDICIEIYNGREQSFISRKAAELLKELVKKILFIPVTTRSIEQYKRIKWQEDIKPEYAVTSNGANLLQNEVIDKDWQHYFFDNIQPHKDELQRQYKKLLQDEKFSICRIVDESFLFLKCEDNTDKIAAELKKQTNLNVENTGQKIYLLPPILNKGEAVNQLKKKFAPINTFCAGDSAMDLPMLNFGNIAYCKMQNGKYIQFNSIEFVLNNLFVHVKNY